jgi:type IV pilus assembly protein PilA
MKIPKKQAFTLVEIMVVVVIIGLLAAVAIPAFKRVTVKSQATTIVNNLRQFESALNQYSLENGSWPPDALQGALPAGMSATNFPVAAWQAGVNGAGGGTYDWDYNVDNITAGIVIAINPANNADPVWAAVDQIIDDGNTATGNFFLVSSNRYKWIIAK